MREGYLFTGLNDDKDGLAQARVGDRVARPRLGPPWFAVCHTLGRVFFTSWPGRLLRVAMVPAATPQEQANLDFAASGIRADAGYTRVLAVDILEELPAHLLFGAHGEQVAPIADHAATLTRAQAATLANWRDPAAAAARSRVWRRWLAQRRETGSYVEFDSANTSPIWNGTSLLFGLVWKSARRSGDPHAFKPDPEPADEGDEILQQPWYDAAAALIDAAIAVGAPDLMAGDEAVVLTRAWRESRRTARAAREREGIVLFEQRTATSWRSLTAKLGPQGDLHVTGQDLNRSMGEYEWAYTVKAADLPALLTALGAAPADDPLTLLQQRCSGPEADRRFKSTLDTRSIPYGFFSRRDE